VRRNARKAYVKNDKQGENEYVYSGIIFVIVPHDKMSNTLVVTTITSLKYNGDKNV